MILRALFLGLGLALPAAAQDGLRPVVTEILTPEAALPGTFIATIEADTTVGVAFELLGRLISRDVNEGDRVEKGQTLAQLDASARAEDRDAARAALDSAEITLGTLTRARERMEQLVKRGVASDAALETVQRNEAVARANLEQARATLARAEDGLARMTLTAPMDGIVIQTRHETGATVAAGDPVVVLASPKGRNAVLTLPNTMVEGLDQDLRFTILAGKLPPEGIEGRLLRIDPASVSQTRMRTTRVALGADAEPLAIGELVEVQPHTSEAATLTLPKSAILLEGEAHFVWVVEGADRKLSRKPVTLGPESRNRVAVSGLEAGLEVVIRGVNALTEGQRVGPAVPAAPPAALKAPLDIRVGE